MARRIVTGDREVARNLRELAKFVDRPANTAARAALAPIRTAARANAPRDSGLLRRSMVIRKDRQQSTRLNPVYGLGFVGTARRYAHLLEFGKTNRDGSVTPGSRFMSTAFDDLKETAVRVFGEKFWQDMNKRLARMRGRR